MIKVSQALPPVKDIPIPTQQELDSVIAKWNANCHPYYRGLLEPNTPASKFLYNKKTLKYIDKRTGRTLSRKEISEAFLFYNRKVSGLKAFK